MNSTWKNYIFLNGIWLTVPILIWNILFANRLPAQFQPDIFWKDIPVFIKYGENIFRTILFAMPVFFMLALKSPLSRPGWICYLGGALVYFASWLLLMFAPNSAWSASLIGFMAPAYTPVIWLTGLALLGGAFYFPLRYHPAYYLTPAILFTIFHCSHTALVYLRNF
jgi:hypothetical protein